MTDTARIAQKNPPILHRTLPNRLKGLFLAVLFTLALMLRLLPVLTAQILIDDELTSYLVATGHSAEYLYQNGEVPFPAMVWVPARQWQRYLQVEQGTSLWNVATDLVSTDIHPPLYFLLLRGWSVLFGSDYATGKILSLLLDLVTFGLLVLSGRGLFSSERSGWLAGLIWLVSPVAILGGATIRQYSLLTIWTVLCTLLLGKYLLHRNSQSQTKRIELALLALAVLGLLTHLVFALIICGAFLALVAVSQNAQRRRILFPLAVIAAGITTTALLIPDAVLLEVYLLPKIETLALQSELGNRLARRSIMLFLPLSLPAMVYLVAYMTARLQNQRLRLAGDRRSRRTLRFLLIMLAVPYGLHSALYLTGLFYPYTVSDHHLLYLTPLVALVSVALVRLVPRTVATTTVTAGILVCLLLVPATRIGQEVQHFHDGFDLHLLDSYDLFLVDNIQRPGLFTYMDPDSTVYAAHQPDLLSRQQEWLPRLLAEGGIYVSLLKPAGRYFIGDADGRDLILEAISRQGNYRPLGSLYQHGAIVSVYAVSKAGN